MNYDEEALQLVRERRLLIDRCDKCLFDTIEPFIGERVIEIGCGMGNLIAHLTDCELVIGIDPSQESVDYVTGQYRAHTNVHALCMDVLDTAFRGLAQLRLDTAVSLNVFEHIERDDVAIQQVFEVLKPGGVFVLIVPAHQMLYGPMDSSIGHYRRYSIGEANRKLTKAGFEIVQQRYMNPIGALGWFTNGRILRRRVPPVDQLTLFNSIMPIVTLVDRIPYVPFGLTVLSVARRPA